jgi:5'-3' exoribonuclease 1
LVKDYEGPEKEVTVAYQMAVSEVTYEDERYIVRDSRTWTVAYTNNQEQKAPPVAEEFPDGEKVIFLGQMAYGAAAQVTSTANEKLGISLAVCKPSVS